MAELDGILERLGLACSRRAAIGSGASGSVLRLTLKDGSTIVAKLSSSTDLSIEARGLELLALRSQLPIPKVIHATRGVLLMQEMPGSVGACGAAELHAAELLAELHGNVEAQGRYGLEFDNLIGPLPQRNTWMSSWPECFREHRLLAMGEAAGREGAISPECGRAIERLAARLERLLPEHPPASLIHGDVWSGNVLTQGGRVTAFLDPSPYYAHAEVELAFITLFSTFSPGFYRRYSELRPIDAEFWSTRRHVYNLYPLLVHARLFGGPYAPQVEATLDRLA